jgi:glycosyltransferase involved in cell wall biosynthesis
MIRSKKRIKLLYLYQAGDSIGGPAATFTRFYPYIKDDFDFSVLCHRGGVGVELFIQNGISAKNKTLPIFPHTTQLNIKIFNCISLLKLPYDIPVGVINLIREIRKEKPDLIFIGSTGLFIAGIIAKFMKIKSILFACEIVHEGRFGLRKLITIKSILRFCDKILCVSTAVRKKFPDSPKISILLNAVDIDLFNPDKFNKSDLQNKLVFCSDSKVVGIFGGIQYAKGHHIFVRWCSKVIKNFPNCVFLIVGAIPKTNIILKYLNLFHINIMKTIRSIIHSNKLASHVYFVKETYNIAEIYAICDIVCMPSEEEAFGYPVIEAGAMGIPVIAYAKGGPLDTLLDRKTGILIKKLDENALANAILNLLEDNSLVNLISQNSRRFISEKFSFNIRINKFKEAVYSVLENN